MPKVIADFICNGCHKLKYVYGNADLGLCVACDEEL